MKSDTTADAIDLHSALSQGDIQPPVPLADAVLPYWKSIISAKDRRSWTPADLEMAAELARTKHRIERLSLELETEPDVIENDRGTLVIHPKHRLLDTLVKRSLSLSRTLQIHALATQGRSADQRTRNDAARSAADTLDGIDDDALIAKPRH